MGIGINRACCTATLQGAGARLKVAEYEILMHCHGMKSVMVQVAPKEFFWDKLEPVY